jgi:hypothetical protein
MLDGLRAYAASLPRKWGWVTAIGLPLVILPLLLVQMEAQALVSTLDRLVYGWVMAGIGCGLIYQLCRGTRFGGLLGLPCSWSLFATMCIHSVARKLLPLSLGEAIGVWLFRRRHTVTAGAGGASIVLARILDLTIVMAVAAALIGAGETPARIPHWAGWALGGALVTIGAAIGALVRAEHWLPADPLSGWSVVAVARRSWSEAAATVRHAMAHRILVPAIVASVLMWAAMYAQQYAFVHALRFDLSAIDVLWVQIVIVALRLLPVQGVADLGTHEAAWFAAASLAGLGASGAAALAIGTHMLVFLALTAYLVIGLVIVGCERPRRPAHRPV